ncbi:Uncharacterised protein [Klebsiella pneumoniae]|nr:Uncharacterised protein [Klebsiella pneumoniae]
MLESCDTIPLTQTCHIVIQGTQADRTRNFLSNFQGYLLILTKAESLIQNG